MIKVLLQYLIFFNEKKIRKIQLIFDIENQKCAISDLQFQIDLNR